MYKNKVLSCQNLEDFNFEETKKNIKEFFINLEKVEWEWAKLIVQKGMSKFDFSDQYKREPYSPIGKDMFGLSAKEYKEEQLKKYIASYYWAKNSLSHIEQIYIEEYFVNRRYENELMEILGFYNTDSNEFRKLKKSAVYKFADFLNLLVEKN